MLKEISNLAPFFEDPYRVYSAREIAKITKISHITVANKLKKLQFIERKKNGPYLGFKAKITSEFINLRFIYNFQKLMDCGLIERLKIFYDEPTIILFGSYKTATNTIDSDIDVAVISTHKNKIDLSGFEKNLNHKIHLFLYTKKDIKNMKTQHAELLNNLCNGMVLNGEFEVFI
jgi:predicted nucleotidyltransferase